MRGGVFAVLAALVASQPALADWTYLTRTEAGDDVFVDGRSVRKKSGFTEIWVQFFNPVDRSYSVHLWAYACDGTSVSVSGAKYAPNGVAVVSLDHSRKLSALGYASLAARVVPDSIDAVAERVACAGEAVSQ